MYFIETINEVRYWLKTLLSVALNKVFSPKNNNMRPVPLTDHILLILSDYNFNNSSCLKLPHPYTFQLACRLGVGDILNEALQISPQPHLPQLFQPQITKLEFMLLRLLRHLLRPHSYPKSSLCNQYCSLTLHNAHDVDCTPQNSHREQSPHVQLQGKASIELR